MNGNQLQQPGTFGQYPSMPDFLSKEDIEALKKDLLAEFNPAQQNSFIRICQRTRLDPFTKQLYPTKRMTKVWDPVKKMQVKVPTLVSVTAITGLLSAAIRTGHYDGCQLFWCGNDGKWRDEWLEPDPPAAAKCIVYHKGRSHSEIGIARWGGYVGQSYDPDTRTWNITDFWSKMPEHMLGKCAKALALRGAFPDQLSDVYISEELDSNVTTEHTEKPVDDEEKYAANRAREAAEKAARPEEFVTSSPAQLTPEQATEPAFPEDRLPTKPPVPPPVPPPPPPVAGPTPPTEPDEIPMGPAVPEPEPAWKNYVILGIRPKKGNETRPEYHKRKIGDLDSYEMGIIENQWLPEIRKKWDLATEVQKRDAEMFEAAIAYYKMEKLPF